MATATGTERLAASSPVWARRATPGRRDGAAVVGLSVAGAALMEWSAALHLYLWGQGYRHIATVGMLFLAQGIVGVVGGPAVAWLRRPLVALAGAGYLASTGAGLLISSRYGTFGFHESLAAPYAGMSLWVEGVGTAVLLAAALMVGGHVRRRYQPASD